MMVKPSILGRKFSGVVEVSISMYGFRSREREEEAKGRKRRRQKGHTSDDGDTRCLSVVVQQRNIHPRIHLRHLALSLSLSLPDHPFLLYFSRGRLELRVGCRVG
jgi:hypothetical protein